MIDSSKILISESALRNNIEFIRESVSQHVKISIVVKSNAYGHGLKLFTQTAFDYGIDHFSVFCFEEAKQIKKHLPDIDVMVMGWISDSHIKEAVKKGIEFYVFETDRLKDALKQAKKTGIKAKLHIEIETGMNRTGMNEDDFFEAIRIIKDNHEHVELKGVCSHLAGPESQANYYRIQNQIKTFEHYKNVILDFDLKPEYFHLANSAATLNYPETHYDMVRLGIISYGLWPNRETFIRYSTKHKNRKDPLARVIRWESKVMSTKNVKKGEFIGYGNYYIANEDMKIAIIPVGYSNSFNRSLSNKGRVLVNGMRCSVIGVVNMNMIIADVTAVQDVKNGDEVVLIGYQNDLQISVSSFSDYTDQLNYETLANLPLNIPRKLVD
jgi:alanine racemase